MCPAIQYHLQLIPVTFNNGAWYHLYGKFPTPQWAVGCPLRRGGPIAFQCSCYQELGQAATHPSPSSSSTWQWQDQLSIPNFQVLLGTESLWDLGPQSNPARCFCTCVQSRPCCGMMWLTCFLPFCLPAFLGCSLTLLPPNKPLGSQNPKLIWILLYSC